MVPFPGKKYNIIYADPPWRFETWSDKGKGRSAEKHYLCMSLKDIKKLPIKDIAADNCTLFLWVIFPLLKEGLDVMEAWGFKYKTCGFVWIKKNRKSNGFFTGLGYYTRANAELCLLGTKGKPLKRQSKAIRQLVVSPVREHSRKPNEVRERIVKLFGDLPRIELFARETPEGWNVWGNEVICNQ